jgi:hypothetical protein
MMQSMQIENQRASSHRLRWNRRSRLPGLNIRPVYLDVTVSPLVAVGSASDLFKTGISTALSGGYTLMRDFGELDLGIQTELTWFNADGILVSSENWLISLGPDAGIGLGLGTHFRLFGGLSTGLTLSYIHVSNGDRPIIFAAYLSGRLGGRVYFSDQFSLTLTNRYTAYFLPSAPVSGFQPSVAAGIRF